MFAAYIIHHRELTTLDPLKFTTFVKLPCRNYGSQSTIFRGHTDGISSFSVWGQDVISISRNKIGLSSLSKSADEVPKQQQNFSFLFILFFNFVTPFLVE